MAPIALLCRLNYNLAWMIMQLKCVGKLYSFQMLSEARIFTFSNTSKIFKLTILLSIIHISFSFLWTHFFGFLNFLPQFTQKKQSAWKSKPQVKKQLYHLMLHYLLSGYTYTMINEGIKKIASPYFGGVLACDSGQANRCFLTSGHNI